jgi:hypothetical protein
MNKKINFGLLLFVIMLSACSSGSGGGSDDGGGSKSASLAITTNIYTRAVMTSFSSGNKMNLFVKNIGNPTATDYKENVSASFSNSSWSISPNVELKADKSAYIYAFYPYSASNTNASAIPVDLSSQTDYLYSGSAVSVNASSPSASLTMKHAMSMLAFNISNQSYTGTGNLTAITISGDAVYTAGTLNVESGTITGTTKGDYQFSKNKTIVAAGWTSDLPQAFCIPFKSTGKNVSVTMTIDSKTYSFFIPSMEVSMGMKYIFHIALTDNGLTIIPNKTETISLNKEDDSMSLGTYGTLKLTSSSKTISIPEITGTDIAGKVDWGDNTQDAYAYPLSHTYATTGTHTIIIETWGGSKLSFSDITNAETIDLTGF